MVAQDITLDYSKYDFKDKEEYIFKSGKGLTEDIVRAISNKKQEPKWMLDFRLKAFEIFKKKSMPVWGADLSTIKFNDFYYYAKPSEKAEKNWDDVPENIKNTFEKLGIPEAEKKFL